MKYSVFIQCIFQLSGDRALTRCKIQAQSALPVRQPVDFILPRSRTLLSEVPEEAQFDAEQVSSGVGVEDNVHRGLCLWPRL